MDVFRNQFEVNAAHTSISMGLKDAFYKSASDPDLMGPSLESTGVPVPGMKFGQ